MRKGQKQLRHFGTKKNIQGWYRSGEPSLGLNGGRPGCCLRHSAIFCLVYYAVVRAKRRFKRTSFYFLPPKTKNVDMGLLVNHLIDFIETLRKQSLNVCLHLMESFSNYRSVLLTCNLKPTTN